MKNTILFSLNLVSFLIINFYLNEYEGIYLLGVLLLCINILFSSSLNTKILSIFLLVYFSIPLLNISSYRGEISVTTLKYYANFIIITLSISLIISNIGCRKTKYIGLIQKNTFLTRIIYMHLLLVYVTLFYLYIKYGNILLNQELRFLISPTLGYVIKSSIYIPIMVFSTRDIILNSKSFIIFIIMPLLPALLIGSRGSVIMIILAIIILNFLFLKKSLLDFSKYKKRLLSSVTLFYMMFFAILVVYVLYYVRRYFSDIYATPEDLIMTYFDVKSNYLYLIIPLYFSLRETIGISNTIINGDFINTFLDYPLFIADFLTVLPGEQPASGQVLGKIIGVVGEGGLTPGILGGLFIDFKDITYAIYAIIIILISILYKKALTSDISKIFYVLTIVNFFHLYHRGFLKPEYLVGYIVLGIYIIFAKQIIIKKGKK